MKKGIAIIVVLVLGAGAWLWLQGAGGPPPHPHVLDEATQTDTTSGPVVGYVDRYGANAWQGIPFAAAPVGELRWRAPRPPVSWRDPRPALDIGPPCPQFSNILSGGGGREPADGPIDGAEDCLYLNVWAPPGANDLPVMLWLHGGGNSIGHGGSYSGDKLAVTENVVVVTINYRLGPLGWFSHPALMTGDDLDDSGNYGTLDVVRALEWTRDNIAAFGGDAQNVTLFGESAGARDTLAMMASPLAEGLFHRAIVQSGGYYSASMEEAINFSDDEIAGHKFSGQELVNQLLINDGLAPDRATAKSRQQDMSAGEVREYLYAKSSADILSVFDGGGFGMIDFVGIRADGVVQPEGGAAEVFASRDTYNSVPVMLGTNRDEPAIFMVRDPRHTETRFGFLPRLIDEAAYLAEVKYGSLAWKARGVDDLARLMHAVQPGEVFAYRFDWDEEGSQLGFDLSTALGAAHGLEIAFAFGEFNSGMNIGYLYPESPARDQLARSMMRYWANFARDGHPGTGATATDARWLAWGDGDARMMILDTESDGGNRMSSEEVSAAQIKAALASDTGISSTELRCRLYATSFRWDGFDAQEYARLGSEGCGDYPAESFWES